MAKVNQSKEYHDDSFSGWTATRWISVCLLFWVALLAASSWFQNAGPSVRSLIIIAPAIAFVGFWCWLLSIRKNKRSND